MAEAFKYERLVGLRDNIGLLSGLDWSSLPEQETSLAAERVRCVNAFLSGVTERIIRDLCPRIRTIHQHLLQLNERL
jgi:hypothetical protein